MDSAQMLVWLERVPDDGIPDRVGVVCRRHADAMVVPRGWTLDDRREARPRLFRVSATDDAKARPKPARRRREPAVEADPAGALQLDFGLQPASPADGVVGNHITDDRLADGSTAHEPVDESIDDEVTVGEIRPTGTGDADETQAIPWRFEFDEADDLGGLLQTDSPLLSRAFRGRQRDD